MRAFLIRSWRLLGSYGLAAILLVLLAILTFFGTWEQGVSTLYDVQTNYFGSIYVVHWLGDFPLLLPGGYLLMGLLFVNLVVGGLLRMRKDVTRIGVFVIHLGMALLLLSGFAEDMLSTKGMMSVSEPGYTPQRGSPSPANLTDEFVSTQEWEVAIVRRNPDGSKTEFPIPESEFDGLSGNRTLRTSNPDVPFDLVLSGYCRNAKVEQVMHGDTAGLNLTALAPGSWSTRREPSTKACSAVAAATSCGSRSAARTGASSCRSGAGRFPSRSAWTASFTSTTPARACRVGSRASSM